MRTGCRDCDYQRAVIFGKIAAFTGRARTAPDEYDDEQALWWIEGYDAERERRERKRQR